MLQLSGALLTKPIMSLRTGTEIARITSAIINPNNLKIEGFYCDDRSSKEHLVLLSQDIRDNIAEGLVVNDHDALTPASELIRLKQILELEFELLGKPVQTISKKKLGKVDDFAVDSQSLYIQKLYVGPTLIKSITSGQLSVDRSQIVEITNRRVVIKEIDPPVKSGMPAAAVA